MTPISIKPGVHLDKLLPAMHAAILIAADLYQEDFPFTVTGGNEPGHETEGPHPPGRAVDLRGRHLNERALRLWAARLGPRLGPAYRVLVETYPDDPDRNHLHVDYLGD